jgi:lipopolysaccharide transport system ATP-binding protein
MPWGPRRHELNWVLRGLNFQIKAGEAVGIIGINGAGKSTLLKMITGTTQATTGTVSVEGRVAALLELGMGFHPEFTGRQNVVMAGQLLGLTSGEVRQLMPEIESFAEIGSYIDQPVRVYSSGMQMRLAFSIATARRPDILIIDEALSVGDSHFQHKSFERIRSFSREGTTLLIVSHDKGAVQGICDRAILLNGGSLALDGDPEAVMDFYNAMLARQDTNRVTQIAQADGGVQTLSGSGEVTVKNAVILDLEGKSLEVVKVGQAINISLTIEVNQSIDQLVIGYQIKDRLGQPIFGTNTFHTKQIAHDLNKGQLLKCDIAFNANLGPGTYSISFSLHDSETHLGKNYEWRDRALVFSVINVEHSHFIGLAWIPPTIEVRRE